MYTRSIIFIFLSICTFSSYALVQITSLQDFNFGTATLPFSTLQQTDNICVYNALNSQVWITATGTHDSGSNFRLGNGLSAIVYQVSIANPGSSVFTQLTPGLQLSRTAQILLPLCTGLPLNNYAQLRITIPAASFNASLAAGNYSDVLTLLLQPR